MTAWHKCVLFSRIHINSSTQKQVHVSERVGAKTLKKLKELGAVAFIGVHGGIWDNDPKLISEPRPKDQFGGPVELPGVSMRMEDAEELVKNHLGETAHLVLKTTTRKVESRNVVAVLTDRKSVV